MTYFADGTVFGCWYQVFPVEFANLLEVVSDVLCEQHDDEMPKPAWFRAVPEELIDLLWILSEVLEVQRVDELEAEVDDRSERDRRFVLDPIEFEVGDDRVVVERGDDDVVIIPDGRPFVAAPGGSHGLGPAQCPAACSPMVW